MFEKRMRLSEGIFWILISVAICLLAFHIDLGSLRAPGPGFVTFLAGGLIGVMGVVMTVAGRRTPKVEQPAHSDAGSSSSRRRLLSTVIILALYALLMEPLGYILATVSAMFSLFFDWQKRNWLWSISFSIGATMASYLIFEVWLRSQLPRGVFPWW